jgi:hypothetical protein
VYSGVVFATEDRDEGRGRGRCVEMMQDQLQETQRQRKVWCDVAVRGWGFWPMAMRRKRREGRRKIILTPATSP